MDLYTLASGIIPAEDVRLFNEIREAVLGLSNIAFDPARALDFDGCDNQITCHLICRALAEFYPVEVHDGYFCKICEHSWLTTATECCIIDPYPVAAGSLLFLSTDLMSPWRRLYTEDSGYADRFAAESFKADLALTISQLRSAHENSTS